MAHILSETGENLGVADGLGINPIDWLLGDVTVQRYRFTLDPASISDGFLLRTGLYWLDSGERMRLKDDASVDALYVLLNN